MVPDRSDNGKKCARNMRILPQKTTSFAYNIQTNTFNYSNNEKNDGSYIILTYTILVQYDKADEKFFI